MHLISHTLLNKTNLIDLSWRIEGALTLDWSLQKIATLPRLDEDDNEAVFDEFFANVPAIGAPTAEFLKGLKYRDFAEIYEENLLNELATSYFRDLLFNGKSDETAINRFTSFERHKVLNWLRSFMEIEE